MRDVKIITVVDDEDVSHIDLDIIEGSPAYLDEANQTTDQRAALVCYAAKGTVHGSLDYGVSWADTYSQDNTILQLNNELQQQIDNYVGDSNDEYNLSQTQYTPQLLMSDEGIGVAVYRGGN